MQMVFAAVDVFAGAAAAAASATAVFVVVSVDGVVVVRLSVFLPVLTQNCVIENCFADIMPAGPCCGSSCAANGRT